MKELVIATGTYTKQDGSQGTNWTKVGIINTSSNGKEYALLDPTVNLAGFKREEGKDMVMCSVVEKQDNNQQNNQQQNYNNNQQQQNYNQPPQQYNQQPNQNYNQNYNQNQHQQ